MKQTLLLLLVSIPALAQSAGEHPRFWQYDATLASRLAAKVSSNNTDWTTLKTRADGYAATGTPSAYSITSSSDSTKIAFNGGYLNSYQGGTWAEAAEMMWQANQHAPSASYAAKAEEILDVINASWSTSTGGADGSTCNAYAAASIPVSVNAGWPTRIVMPAIGYLYDLAYDGLSAGQRSATAATVNCFWTYVKAKANDANGPVGSNYFIGHLYGFSIAALACKADSALCDTVASEVLSRITGTVVPQGLQAGGAFAGGWIPEGYTNYGTGVISNLVKMCVAWKSVTEGATDPCSGYLGKFPEHAAYARYPNGYRIENTGDWIPAVEVGELIFQWANWIAYWLELDGQTTESAYMQHWINTAVTSPGGASDSNIASWIYNYQDRFLARHTGRTATDYTGTFAKTAHYEPVNDFYVRTDWTGSAILGFYRGGTDYYAGHTYAMHGNFNLVRGSDLLLSNIGSWKGTTGMSGSPSIYEGGATSAARANVLYFHDYPRRDNCTTLTAGASAGATSITVAATSCDSGALNATANRTIVISPGDSGQEELAVIASVAGLTLNLTAPLANNHDNGDQVGYGWARRYLNAAATTSFGGQGLYAHNTGLLAGVVDLVRSKTSTTHAYALSNLYPAYDQSPGKQSSTTNTLPTYYRQWAWLGGGYFIVRDYAASRAKTEGGTHDKRQIWHLPPNTSPSTWTAPTINSDVATSATIGTSKLVIASPGNTLTLKYDAATAPAAAPLSETRYDARFHATPASIGASNLTFRIEVTDPTPGDTFEANTVLMALGSSDTVPAVNAIATISAAHTGVEIADSTTPLCAVLPLSTETESTVTFTTTHSGAATCLVAGLDPGSAAVTIGGSPIFGSPFTVQSDGTLLLTGLAAGATAISVNAGGDVTIVTGSPLAEGTESSAYSTTIQAVGGIAPYAWDISAGALPTGLSINASTGEISGTPTATGDFSFTVRATDDVSTVGTRAFVLHIEPIPIPLSIASVGYSTIAVAQASSFSVVASGGNEPYTYSVLDGTLPDGLTLESDGDVAGQPTTIGSATVTFRVKDNSMDTADLVVQFNITASAEMDSLRAVAASSAAVIRWSQSGLDSAQSCSYSVVDDQQFEVASGTVNDGPAARSIAVALTGPGGYRATVQCGVYARTVNFTAPASSSNLTFSWSSGAPGVFTPTYSRLRYGGTSALGSTSSVVACTAGACAINLTRDSGVIYVAQDYCSDSACDTVLASTPVQAYIVK